MHVSTDSPFWGIEDDCLVWSKQERDTLLRAASLLGRARELVGPDTPMGEDLGKGEVVLRDWCDGGVIKSRVVYADLI